MAAIGKIRSWGPWLVGIIGLALFGFIATDFTRSCETSSNQARQQVGEVMGSKLSIQDYQSSIEEYKNVFKQLGQNVEEDQLREFVWNDYVRNSIIEAEAKKLGLGVTDEEIKNILAEGTHPLLQRGNLPLIPMFYNQQTGMFDYNNVTQVYAYMQQQAPEQLEEFDRYWKSVEKILRQSLLAQKYMTLLQSCILSNEASAKLAFDGRSTESQIELASLAYSTINDNDVTISDADLKAKYDEMKNMFQWNRETRDVKYVVCNVVPSETDMTNLRNGLLEAAEELKADSMSLTDITGSHRSTIAYREGMPYNANGLKRISPSLFARLDSMSEKQVTEPFSYNTFESNKMVENMAVAKLNRRYVDIDSVNYKYIGVPGQSFDDAVKRADSLMAVLKSGISLDSVAASIGQTVADEWISADIYQNQENVDPMVLNILNSVRNAAINEPQQLTLQGQGVMLYVVKQRKNATLYDVTIVSNEVRFSNDTEENTYNKFSQYISECSTADDLDKNAAKYNFQVLTQENLQSNANSIGYENPLPNTRDAVKWVFAKANEGNISEIFRNSADGRFMAVALTKIHPKGFLDQKSVESFLRAEVLKDKKADMLIKQLGGAKTVAEAVQKGAIVDTISHITFPTAVNVKGQQERGLCGAVAAVANGEASKNVVKGSNGVFLFNVLNRIAPDEHEFDRREQENNLISRAISYIQSGVFNVLMEKAKVEDNRHLF